MISKLSIAVCAACLLAVYACNDNTKTDNANGKADSSVLPPEVNHPTATTLDWNGTYKGVLPCADCQGIETTLMLNKDSTYEITTKYLGGKKEVGVNEKGTFSWNAEGNTITLSNAKDRPAQYFVSENKVTQLDMQGNKITGDMAAKYVLTKQ